MFNGDTWTDILFVGLDRKEPCSIFADFLFAPPASIRIRVVRCRKADENTFSWLQNLNQFSKDVPAFLQILFCRTLLACLHGALNKIIERQLLPHLRAHFGCKLLLAGQTPDKIIKCRLWLIMIYAKSLYHIAGEIRLNYFLQIGLSARQIVRLANNQQTVFAAEIFSTYPW